MREHADDAAAPAARRKKRRREKCIAFPENYARGHSEAVCLWAEVARVSCWARPGMSAFACCSGFAYRNLWNVASSIRLNVGSTNHLAPLLGFVGDELSKLGGGAGKNRAAQFGEPRLDRRIGESRVDLLIEHIDDLDARSPGRSDSEPVTRLVAR